MAAKGMGNLVLAVRKWMMLITDYRSMLPRLKLEEKRVVINEFSLRVKLSLSLACYRLQNLSSNQ